MSVHTALQKVICAAAWLAVFYVSISYIFANFKPSQQRISHIPHTMNRNFLPASLQALEAGQVWKVSDVCLTVHPAIHIMPKSLGQKQNNQFLTVNIWAPFGSRPGALHFKHPAGYCVHIWCWTLSSWPCESVICQKFESENFCRLQQCEIKWL